MEQLCKNYIYIFFNVLKNLAPILKAYSQKVGFSLKQFLKKCFEKLGSNFKSMLQKVGLQRKETNRKMNKIIWRVGRVKHKLLINSNPIYLIDDFGPKGIIDIKQTQKQQNQENSIVRIESDNIG